MGNKTPRLGKTPKTIKTPKSMAKKTMPLTKTPRSSKKILFGKEIDETEDFLCHFFKNTGVNFNEKEILNLKLRLNDAECYFCTKFDYFICYNSYLFNERINQLYDNYNNKIESLNLDVTKKIKLLIEFDDETESILAGNKIEFDTLLTIILEKLEIEVVLYFDMSSLDASYIADFFYQMVESIEMYKYNRKFENMYFLLPNTDFLIKYENSIIYVTHKEYFNMHEELFNLKKEKKSKNLNPVNDRLDYFTNANLYEVKNEYLVGSCANIPKEQLLSCRYLKLDNGQRSDFEIFIEESKPTYVKLFIRFYSSNMNHIIGQNDSKTRSELNVLKNIKDIGKDRLNDLLRNQNELNLLVNNENGSANQKVNDKSNIIQGDEICSDANVENINIDDTILEELNKINYNNTSTEQFSDMNADQMKTVSFLADKVQVINILVDNFHEFDSLKEIKFLYSLCIEMINITNSSPIYDQIFVLKFIIKQNLSNEFKSQTYKLLNLLIKEKITPYINTLKKRFNRQIKFEIIELSPIEDNPKSGYHALYDQYFFRWNLVNQTFTTKTNGKNISLQSKGIDFSFILPVIAYKVNNFDLFDEEVVRLMSSFLLYKYEKKEFHEEKKVNSKEFYRIII